MRFKDKREFKHTKIEIIPMIDTMFFLLVFFILAALNIIDLRGLNITLPPAGMAQMQSGQDIDLQVQIAPDGTMRVNQGEFLPQGSGLGKALLDEIRAKGGDNVDLTTVTLIIAPDGETPHDFVIKAVDEARGVKLEKFSMR
jgi:biopolymer transport protein ExbD